VELPNNVQLIRDFENGARREDHKEGWYSKFMWRTPADGNNIIIVGAGPAGLLVGILLSKQGINITVVEGANKLNENPRAAHYASIAVQEMRRAGVLDDVQKEGFKPTGVCWREPDGEFIAGIKSPTEDPEAMVVLPLDKLVRLYYRHLQKQPTAEVKWEHKVVD
jgi:2-polyprenyl-6-methoxyphenol hydroxylase-like FAD-dependent oxidoreductase